MSPLGWDSEGITTQHADDDKPRQNLTLLPLVISCYYKYNVIVFFPSNLGRDQYSGLFIRMTGPGILRFYATFIRGH